MKKINRLFLGMLCAFSVCGMATSCTDPQEKADEIAAQLLYPNLKSLSIDFKVYEEMDGAKITYESSDTSVLEFKDGVCLVHSDITGTPGAKEKMVSFTATVDYKGKTSTKRFNVIVVPAGISTTASAIVAQMNSNNLDKENPYRIKGRYVADSGAGALVYDGTGYVYVYGACAVANVGEYIVVDAKLDPYGGTAEMKSPSYGVFDPDAELKAKLDAAPEAKEIKSEAKFKSIADVADMAKVTGTYVKVTGKVYQYLDTGKNKVYSNFYINGIDNTKCAISLIYTTAMDAEISKYNTNKAYNGTYEGDVVLEGYSIYKSSSGSLLYMNFIPTSIQPA